MSRQKIITDSKFSKYFCNSQIGHFDSNNVLKIPKDTDLILQINRNITISEVRMDKSSRLIILIEEKNKVFFDKKNYQMFEKQISYEILDNQENSTFSDNKIFAKALIGENIIFLNNDDCQ